MINKKESQLILERKKGYLAILNIERELQRTKNKLHDKEHLITVLMILDEINTIIKILNIKDDV